MNFAQGNLVYVLSFQVGDIGGQAKATRLLCEAYVRLGQRVRLFVTVPPLPEVAARLAAQNIAIVTPRFNKGWRRNWPQKQIAGRLFAWARRERPALVHGVSLSPEARYLLQLPRVAPVFLWETTEALPHVKFVDKAIFGHLSKVTGLLAPSQTVTRNIRSTYGYTGPIARLPFWSEAPEAVSPPTNTRSGNFLYVGRLDVDKGFQYLFEALRSLREEYPAARVTVRGGGNIEAIRQLAQGDTHCDIGGPISGEEYERALATCDAIVLPSLHEGYPLSLLEACARRKPIIATRVGSIPEVFDGRACALLVPPRDSVALRVAMAQIMSDDEATYAARLVDAGQLFEEISSPHAIENFLKQAFEEPHQP